MATLTGQFHEDLRKEGAWPTRSTPRRFTDEFKRQIVDLYNAGKPPSEIEREYDLGHSTLRRWSNR